MSINSDVVRIVQPETNARSGILPQMSLGTFKFELNTAFFQELSRSREWRWPNQDRLGQTENLQFLGNGKDEITLQGIIYPEFRGAVDQIEKIADLAKKGKPQILIDGYGKVYGRFVIMSIEEKHSIFAGGGRSRRQEFTLKLRYFDGGTPSVKSEDRKLLGSLGL